MGTWGTGLYQNDAASDVRALYRDCRTLGFSGPELVSIVLESVGGDAPSADDESALAYLALADLLWKDGMLAANMKRTALGLIGDPALLLRWDDDASRKAHRKMLDALAQRLQSAQRVRAAGTKKRYVEQCDFAVGEVLAYPHPKGRWTLLRVAAYYTRFKGRSPICDVLDWRRSEIPSRAVIERLSFRKLQNTVVVGSGRPEETLKEVIAAGWLPATATWKDYEDQMIAPYIPIIRVSENDRHFLKAKRLSIIAPAPRTFFHPWFVATNAWTTWKALPEQLDGYFAELT